MPKIVMATKSFPSAETCTVQANSGKCDKNDETDGLIVEGRTSCEFLTVFAQTNECRTRIWNARCGDDEFPHCGITRRTDALNHPGSVMPDQLWNPKTLVERREIKIKWRLRISVLCYISVLLASTLISREDEDAKWRADESVSSTKLYVVDVHSIRSLRDRPGRYWDRLFQGPG